MANLVTLLLRFFHWLWSLIVPKKIEAKLPEHFIEDLPMPEEEAKTYTEIVAQDHVENSVDIPGEESQVYDIPSEEEPPSEIVSEPDPEIVSFTKVEILHKVTESLPQFQDAVVPEEPMEEVQTFAFSSSFGSDPLGASFIRYTRLGQDVRMGSKFY